MERRPTRRLPQRFSMATRRGTASSNWTFVRVWNIPVWTQTPTPSTEMRATRHVPGSPRRWLRKTYWKPISRLLFQRKPVAAKGIWRPTSRTSSRNTDSLTLALRQSWASGRWIFWGSTRTRSISLCGAPQRVVVSLGMTTLISTNLSRDQCSGSTCTTRCAGSSTSCRHLYPRIKSGPHSKTHMTAVHMSNSAMNLV